MPLPSERRPLGRLLLATIAFVIVAPVGLAAIPLAVLAVVAAPRPRALVLVGITAAVAGAVWLGAGSDLPDQTARAAALIGGVVFAATYVRARGSFTHRALLSVAVTAVLVATLLAAVGSTWHELQWFVSRDLEFQIRAALGAVVGNDRTTLAAVEPTLRRYVALMGATFPAVLALQLAAGYLLAASIVERVAPGTMRPPPGRFRDFGFSEHLGWLAVAPAAVLIIAYVRSARSPLLFFEQAGGVSVAAANILVIAGVLYALRGLAVVACALAVERNRTLAFVSWVIVALLALLSLLVAFIGAILLGLLDSVLDIRRRWLAPPPIGA